MKVLEIKVNVCYILAIFCPGARGRGEDKLFKGDAKISGLINYIRFSLFSNIISLIFTFLNVL